MSAKLQTTHVSARPSIRLLLVAMTGLIGLTVMLFFLLRSDRLELSEPSRPVRPPALKPPPADTLAAKIERANQTISKEDKERLVNSFKTIPPIPLPTPAEIEEFLELNNRDDKSLAWAFVKSLNLKYLQEGLINHPDSFLLHFIAARLPESATASTPESQTLTLQSLDWLSQHNPGIHALLLATTAPTPDPKWLQAINDADFTDIPETILDAEDVQFLQSIRKFSPEEAKDRSSPGNYFYVKPLLMQLALQPSDTATQLTALFALPASNEVDTQAANIAMQSAILKSPSLGHSDDLIGESAEEIAANLRSSTVELESLRTLRQSILRSNDARSIEQFEQLKAELGEIAALKQIRDQ